MAGYLAATTLSGEQPTAEGVVISTVSGGLERVSHTHSSHDYARDRFLQTDPVGYEDDLNLYAYVRSDPVNNGDPTGTLTIQFGVELKGGLREQPAASGAIEPGIAIGTRSDGNGWDVRGFTTETWGMITGQSADAQLTICLTCDMEDLDGVDAGIANVDIPLEGGGDWGVGGQVRLTDSGLQGQAQFSAGVGMSQEVGSVSATQTHDILTPVLDAGAEAVAAARIATHRVENWLEETFDRDKR